MLIADYYKILERYEQDGETVFCVELNKGCKVYEGHFPGEPVSPGVCNIQMIKECAEEVCGRPLTLRYIQQCRFTKLITPVVYPSVEVRIRLEEAEGCIKLRGSIGNGEETFLELKGEVI